MPVTVQWGISGVDLAAGVNDAFRQGGIAVGVAVFGALVPVSAALGHRAASAYLHGLHHALILGAAVAAAGAVTTVVRFGARRGRKPKRQPAVTLKPAAESA